MSKQKPIELRANAAMKEYQKYIRSLEEQKDWLDVDLVHNCFLMGEEVGELFKSIRRYNGYLRADNDHSPVDSKKHVAEEIVDVFNYLLAIANRLEIDIEDAFRKKNAINQGRSWDGT